jgi:MFS family permease
VLGRVSDRIGRRRIFLFSLLWSGLTGLIGAAAPDIYSFILMRLLLGIGYGGNLVTEFVLLAEMMPSKDRGRALAITDVFYAVGSIFSVLVAWAIIPSLGWRYMMLFSSLPPLIVFAVGSVDPRVTTLLGAPEPRVRSDRRAAHDRPIRNKASDAVKQQIRQLKLNSASSVESRTPDPWSFMLHERLIRVTLTLLGAWFFNSFASCLYIWLPLYVKESPSLEVHILPYVLLLTFSCVIRCAYEFCVRFRSDCLTARRG